jgi:hypothetical protein
LVIGRLPECGIPVTQDPTVSRQQCRIEYPGPDATLVQLSQTSDTLVNGAPATRIEIRKGDSIEFGTGNVFRVRQDTAPAPAAAPPAGKPQKSPRTVHYVMTPASCGWSSFQFPENLESPQQLLEALARSGQVRAIVDFSRAKSIPVEPDPTWTPLFTWLPADQQLQFSPMIVNSPSGKPDLIKATWGKDAIVIASSGLDDAAFLAHWQKVSGIENGQPGTTLSVYHWPSLLRMILTCQTPAQTAPFLSKLTWIVVEDPAAPGQVVLFAPQSFAEELSKLGFLPSSTSNTVVAPPERD